jgi:hypothetical protein
LTVQQLSSASQKTPVFLEGGSPISRQTASSLLPIAGS